MFDHNYQNPNQKKKGFYIAMSVCIFAVFAAACSTYQSVKQLINFSNSTVTQSKKSSSEVIEKEDDFNNFNDFVDNEESIPSKNLIPEDEKTMAVNNPNTDSPILFPLDKNEVKVPFSQEFFYNSELDNWRPHKYTEFISKTGNSVKAITVGKVKFVLPDSSDNCTQVTIEHNIGSRKFISVYHNLEGVSVKVNQNVSPGDEIGRSASDVFVLEIYENGSAIDPYQILPNN